MFDQPEAILRNPKGSLDETPLEQIFEAVVRTRRTCGVEIKRQALEKVVVFERGVPVGCSSNLVQESIGRVLLDRGLLQEKDYQTLLLVCAERSLRFETALARSRLLDAATLEKQLQLNLAQKILDCFRWTDAKYRIVNEVAVDPDGPRMNAGQLLYTAVCASLPYERVTARFPTAADQRWARPPVPRHRPEELKLSTADAALLSALDERPTFGELCQHLGPDTETLTRRLYALSLLGLADHSENVSEQAQAPAAPAAQAAEAAAAQVADVPEAQVARFPRAWTAEEPGEQAAEAPSARPAAPIRSRGAWVGLGAAVGLAAAFAFFLTLHGAPAPAEVREPPPLVLKAPRPRPAGTHLALEALPPLPAAPPGARPRPDRPRGIFLSASGIALEPPAPGPKVAGGQIDAATRFLKAGKPEAALPLYEKAARAAATNADAAFGTALAHFAAGQDEDARRDAERALALRADHAEANLLLGFLDQELARGPEAVAHYQRFVELAAPSPRADDVRELIARLAP